MASDGAAGTVPRVSIAAAGIVASSASVCDWRAPTAVRAAIDAWGEAEAVRLDRGMTGRPWAPGEDAAPYGTIGSEAVDATVAPDSGAGADAPDLGLTQEVISTFARYRTAAARVAEALAVATGTLEAAVRAADAAGCWSVAGIGRALKLRAKLLAHEDRRERILRCTTGQVGVPVFRCAAGCGEARGVPMGCNARVCPRCAPKLRRQNERHVLELLDAVDAVRKKRGRGPATWRFVTLTIRSQASFAPMRRAFAKYWGKLIRRAFWRRAVGACVAFFETTHTAAGWHVHLHAIVDGFVDRHALCRHWRQVTNGEGEEQGVHISLPKGSRAAIAHELSKYLAKDLAGAAADEPGDFGVAGDRDRLAEFYLGSLRWRALRTYGDAFDALRLLQEQKRIATLCCEECGQPMTYDRTEWTHAADLVALGCRHRRAARAPP